MSFPERTCYPLLYPSALVNLMSSPYTDVESLSTLMFQLEAAVSLSHRAQGGKECSCAGAFTGGLLTEGKVYLGNPRTTRNAYAFPREEREVQPASIVSLAKEVIRQDSLLRVQIQAVMSNLPGSPSPDPRVKNYVMSDATLLKLHRLPGVQGKKYLAMLAQMNEEIIPAAIYTLQNSANDDVKSVARRVINDLTSQTMESIDLLNCE